MNRISLVWTTVAGLLFTTAGSAPGMAVQDSLVITHQVGDVTAPGPPPAMTSLEIAPAEVLGGKEATGTIRFDGVGFRRPGEVVELSSSAPALASVPATVPLSGGTVSFTIGTSPIRATRTVEITARKHGERTAQLTVRAPLRLVSLRLKPTTVAPGERAGAVIELNDPALTETRVRLSASHPTVAQVPEEVVIAPGVSSGSFFVTAGRSPLPGTVTIRAEMGAPSRPHAVEAALEIRP